MTVPALPVSRLFAGPYPAIEEKLISRLPDRMARNGGWEQVLLVPSNELREHLLRRLASRWKGVAVGASIQTLYDFTLRLLKHRGIFPRELPPAMMSAAIEAAVREVYAGGEGVFQAIAGKPGFFPALSRTLADFEEGWLGPDVFLRASLQARGEGRAAKAARWSEWRRLATAVDRNVHAMGGMTRRRIFQEAVAGFEQPGYPFRVSLYGFYDFTRLQWTLVEALLGSGLLDEAYFPGIFLADGSLSPACFYALLAWDRLSRAFEGNVELLSDPVPPGLRAVRDRIFHPSPPDTPAAAPVTILSAPHEEGEARLAARQVRGWLDRHPADEVLLLSRRFEEEAISAWERASEEYGIRTVERLTIPLSSAPPVRVLLQMIEAAREDFPRRKVIDILSSPYRRPAAAPAATPRPDLWDVWSRELLVVSGDDWEKRLVRLRLRDPGEGEGTREDQEAQLSLLKAEVRALRGSLRPLREAGNYRALANALRRILVRNFRFIDDAGVEGERDRRALSALFALLDDIERIPVLPGMWPGSGEALAWFESLLADQRLFAGERGGMRVPGAVVAGDVHALRGVTADRVIFLSANEDVVPSQTDEDPLLPDDDRETLNRLTAQPGLPDALSLRRRSAAREKLLFALPAAQARREIAFSALRADAGGAVKRPSRYLLHLLAQFAGPEVFSEEWASKSQATYRFLPRAPFAVLRSEGPLSRREEALRRWRDGIPPGGGAGGGIPWQRIVGTLAEWGMRGEGISLFPRPSIVARRPEWSATELDDLARCPYRYFLRFRLRLSPVEEPEEELSLSPAEAGLLLHDILQMLGNEAASGKGWGDAVPAARKAFARFARENPTGLPGLFLLRCREIERDAAAFVEWERIRAGGPEDYRVAAVEHRFSAAGREGFPALRGRVDRIDRGPRGEAEIIDYKYREGAREKAPLEWILNGLASQIPVYLSFAQALSPPPPRVRATLFFLKNGIRAVTVEGEQWKAVKDGWSAAVADWIALDRSGAFPPLPHHRFRYAGSPAPRYCDACLFADHCRVSPRYEGAKRETDALVHRVATDPALGVVVEHRPAVK